MSDESRRSDSVEELGASGRGSAFGGGRSRAPQIGQGVPDIELVDDDGAPAPPGRSTYSNRIAASRDGGVQLPDEQVARLESERDQALEALEALEREFEQLREAAEGRVDAKDLTRVTTERDRLAEEVLQLKQAAKELENEVAAATAPDEYRAVVEERDALSADLARLRELEAAAEQESKKLAELTRDHEKQAAEATALKEQLDQARGAADERIDPAVHQQIRDERDALERQLAGLKEIEATAKDDSRALASLSKAHEQQSAALERLEAELGELRESEKVAKQEQTKLAALTKKHEAKVAAHDKAQAELKELRDTLATRVDPEIAQALETERDGLIEERDALTAELERLRTVEEQAEENARRLTTLTEDLAAERTVNQKLQAEHAALQQLADERVDAKVHEAVVKDRDAVTAERDALEGEIGALREIEKTAQEDARKLAALTEEYEGVVAAREKLQVDFDELRRIVDERVTQEAHRAVVDERDALTNALEEARKEAEIAEDRSSKQLIKLEADRDRQVAALQRLTEEFGQLRRIADGRVEPQEHRSVVAERDALSEKNEALIATHRQHEEELGELRARLETMVEGDRHADAIRERDEVQNDNAALVAEVNRLRDLYDAARADSEKLAALTDEHGRQMAAFETLKNDFKELRTQTEEWVDVETHTELASDRDALERDRDHLLGEVKRLKEAASADADAPERLERVTRDYEEQTAAFKKLQSDFDKYRKDTALERAAAKRAGIALGDFQDEAAAAAILAHEAPVAESSEGASSEELEALTKERDEYLDGLKRLQAEFENFRKRTARDRQAEGMRSARQLMEEVLPVMDNLGLASAALNETDSDQSTGVGMVLDQLRGVFASRGCRPVEVSEGDPFDPAVHEAVQAVPSDEHPQGSVVSVVQPGYRLEDGTLLRPVRVVVAGAPNGA